MTKTKQAPKRQIEWEESHGKYGAILTAEMANGLQIKITQDPDAQSPSDWESDDCFIVANHRQFYVPPPGQKRCPSDPDEVLSMFKDTHHVFNLEAYIHSGVRLALSGEGNFPDRQWDVSQLGFVFASKKEWRLRKSARKAAESIIETWNQYLSGDVWGFDVTDEDGNSLDSCCGFYGLNYAKEQAIESAEHCLENMAAEANKI